MKRTDRQMLTVEEACERLGCTRQTLWSYHKRGALLPYPSGLEHRTYYDAAQVDALAQDPAVQERLKEKGR